MLALTAQAASASPKIIAVNVDGVVHPVTAEIVASAISQARQENASLVLVRLNTPGGLMDAMETTIQEILASSIPVVTYVTPSGGRAASAGFFILESGDVAAMAPSTRTGAAHPVAMTGEMDAVMTQKVVNDAAAGLRSLCIKRGRNAQLAETAIRESKSFTEREALDQHLIDVISPSEQQLLTDLDGRTVTRIDGRTETLHTAGGEIVNYQLSLRQRIVSCIADPNIALVLLVVGALCLYLELNSPGLVVPGVAGAIMVLLGLSALSVLPIDWLGAALLLLAFGLFLLEAKFATHGILAVGGAISMLLGAVMLVDSPLPEMRVHWGTAIALTLPFSAITVFLLSLAMRARRNKVETGSEGMIGETGSVVTELAPEGKIFVHGEYWDAVSPRPVAVGGRVRVTAIDKLKLKVEPLVD
ncbi:MAG TPA: nodulation protein NfeD [Bryobacteraceae bacterium]|jgi:membrane-bound serine protease (ClpP class)|nr:nodulation protein NfeD [Bryobacteraceae bacterium]